VYRKKDNGGGEITAEEKHVVMVVRSVLRNTTKTA
jgi:hypothetical protein